MLSRIAAACTLIARLCTFVIFFIKWLIKIVFRRLIPTNAVVQHYGTVDYHAVELERLALLVKIGNRLLTISHARSTIFRSEA